MLSKSIKTHVLSAFSRYWPKGGKMVSELPVPEMAFSRACEAPDYALVKLPDWACKWGVKNVLLVPCAACMSPHEPQWWKVDWWLAAFLMLECWPERCFEQKNGPVHSYSNRLKGWDARVWDRAWVNRIALFLRAWAAQKIKMLADEIFGPVPRAEIQLTHDVDAVEKTMAIRLKQGVFNLVNCGKHIASWHPRKANEALQSAVKFLFYKDDWWTFDKLLEKEAGCKTTAWFHFYADPRKKNILKWLFDPGYEMSHKKIEQIIPRILSSNGRIGLHLSYDAWQDANLIWNQKQELEKKTGLTVNVCRQHWLRFSWDKTWAAQEQAGLTLDTTLMFNDRPGFRSASAVKWCPWHHTTDRPHEIEALPTIFMDSQFYDYHPMTPDERRKSIYYWLNEINQVGGQAALLWHPHTLSRDYGWESGFNDLLAILKEKKNYHL